MDRAVRRSGWLAVAVLAALAAPAWGQTVGPLEASNNLSDLGSPSAARANLGLGPLATGAMPAAGLVQSNGTSLSAATVGTGLTFSGGTLAVSGMCPLGGCTFTGGITAPSLTLTVSGTVGTAPFQINGSGVLNLLANQSSPILSPETQNSPAPDALYIGRPEVLGYSETAGAATYASMTTDNLSVVGTVTNHWGELEQTINLQGSGTLSGELNNQKNYVNVPAGLTLSTGENYEAAIDNAGDITARWVGLVVNPSNSSTGTVNQLIGVFASPDNFNVAPGSLGAWSAFECSTVGGGGAPVPAGFDQCVYNADPNEVITNAGHYGARPDAGQPTLSACGTSPSMTGRSSDDAGTITEGTSATGCTLTFKTAYPFVAPTVLVVGESGTQVASPDNSSGVDGHGTSR